MEEFNLKKHTAEEIPGKFIIINSVKYIFRNKIADGENAWIYPLQHAQSGFSQFVGKVLKLDDQSELYQQISHSKADNSFRLNIETNSSIALHTELYEVNGTLIKFQAFLGDIQPDEEDAYQPALMKEAFEHFRNNKFQKVINIYEQVLAQNPYHIDALINLAGCYVCIGEETKAFKSIYRAIEIDKNDRTSYFHLSKLYLSQNNHEGAIYALKLTLDRFAYDSKVLMEIIDICLDYDLMEQAVENIAFIHNYLGLSVEEYFEINLELKEKVIASQFRIRDYNQLLNQASEKQANQQYQEAEAILAQAMAVSKNNEVAEFNYYLCKFYLGERAITKPLLQLYSRINDLTRKSYCLLLCLLIAADIEDYPFRLSKAMIDLLVSMLKDGSFNIYDLPRIPLEYYQFYALENLDLEPILNRLRTLKQKLEDKENVNLLYESYQQFAKELASRN